MSHRKRTAAITAAVLGMGVAAVAVAVSSATASLPGDSAVLTASDGTTTGITINYLTPGTSMKVFTPGSTTVYEPVTDVSWSPNGMRAVYVTTGQAIHTVRYNAAADSYYLVPAAAAGVTRSHPTWSSDGSMIFWSEQETAGGPWQLEGMLASYGATPFKVSPNDGQDYTHPDAGPDGQIAVQVNTDSSGTPSGAASTEIYDMTTGAFGSPISGAAEASISPDGTKLAYIASGQVMVSTISGSGAASITTDTTDQTVDSPANPVWSPDGKQVAFNNGGGSDVVTTLSAGAMPIESVDGLSGAPAYQPINKDQPIRLAGANRIETAVDISEAYWADAGDSADGPTADAVVLSRQDDFADALGGSALAAAKNGPLLLTSTTSLSTETSAEIQRILSPGATVYILGGTGAISADVESEVTALGYDAVRIGGANRFETSLDIADAINPDPDLILTATGDNFPDALGAGAAAGSFDLPGSTVSAVVILTNDGVLPADVKTYLDDWAPSHDPATDLYAIGGQAATALASGEYDNVGLAGSNRYETAEEVATTFFFGETGVGIAGTNAWPDALAGGALLAELNAPLLLSPFDSVNTYTSNVMDAQSGSLEGFVTFGGGFTNAFYTAACNIVSEQEGCATLVSSSAKAQLKAPTAKTPNTRTPAQLKKAAEATIKQANQ